MDNSEKYRMIKSQFGIKGVHKIDDEGIIYAIKEGCRDMAPRTMKRNSHYKDTDFDILKKDLCDDGKLLEHIKLFFNEKKDEVEFDKWHADACKIIITWLNKYYMSKSVTYGKAQKVINIAMKNIFCMDGAEKFYDEGYFEYCHMALDSFILEWVYRMKKGKPIPNIENEKFSGENFIAWGNLSNKTKINKNGKHILSYQDIQQQIRAMTMELQGFRPFEAEFFIWKQMQVTIAAETLYNIDKDKKEIEDFRKKNISEKLVLLKECIDIRESDKKFI